MERTVKLGDLIEIKYRAPIFTRDGYKSVAYAYVSKLDVKFGDNAIGFDAKYLNDMGIETCTLGYTPSPYWRVVS